MKLSLFALFTELNCLFLVEGWRPAASRPPGRNYACGLPPKKGVCKASISKFYFDSTANECKEFRYGGCGGNANNFDSKKECERRCGKQQECKPTICSMPPAVGRCKAAIPRLYFNETVNKCLEFLYGGCGGNGNNFESKEECEQKCGRKPACKPTPSNPTRKPTPCEMLPEVGPCKASIPRFYFNETIHKCVRFVYGGCGGNENNFESKHDCERKCRWNKPWKPTPTEPTVKPAACSMRPVTGNCKASITRYYFDSKTNKCEKFIYGGCGGNTNNFDSIKQCKVQCGDQYNKKRDPCLRSQHKGNVCLGEKKLAVAVWYYDSHSKKCWMSKYEKCGKNLTKFRSCSKCVSTCQAHMETIQVCEKEVLPK